MTYSYIEKAQGSIRLLYGANESEQTPYLTPASEELTILWNRGAPLTIAVDDMHCTLHTNHVVFLSAKHAFQIAPSPGLIAWQFDRDFYCIVDHDEEVSCAGLLFYGSSEVPFLRLSETDIRSFDILCQVFVEEFEQEDDNLKAEMLRVLLKRLIVKLTRLYKAQVNMDTIDQEDLDLIRKFSLKVELHFADYHQVQDYADLLHRSPKTISNVFSRHSAHTPLQLIHDRILLECKRLLLFTDKTAKEIAREVGFSEFANFSRFFKKRMGVSASEYRKTSGAHANREKLITPKD